MTSTARMTRRTSPFPTPSSWESLRFHLSTSYTPKKRYVCMYVWKYVCISLSRLLCTVCVYMCMYRTTLLLSMRRRRAWRLRISLEPSLDKCFEPEKISQPGNLNSLATSLHAALYKITYNLYYTICTTHNGYVHIYMYVLHAYIHS